MWKFSLFLTILTFFSSTSCETYNYTYEVTEFHAGSPIILTGSDNYESIEFTRVLGTIPRGTFINFPNTTSLSLGSRIFYIESGAFEGLDRIKTLDLSWNSLNFLTSGIFTGAQTLKRLILTGNPIAYIEPGTFSHLKYLESLELDKNYRFYIILNDTFSGLTHLQSLNLERTGIINIEPYAFRGLDSVKNISLRHNALTHVPVPIVEIRSLEFLDIGYNRLPNISNELMRWMTTQLKRVDISGNPAICQDEVRKNARGTKKDTVMIGECK